MVLMAFQICSFPLRQVTIQDLLGHNTRMRVGESGEMFFTLPQHVHDFVRDIRIRNFVGGTQSDAVLSSRAMRRLEN